MAPLPTFLRSLFTTRTKIPHARAVTHPKAASRGLESVGLATVTAATVARYGTATTSAYSIHSNLETRILQIQARAAAANPSSGQGVTPPGDFNNAGLLALFAILGAGMVVGSLWFFFWAKNGGFRWRRGDWDDYKSTVLRRKGPDGKTLSNATKSTKLGGGTIAGSQHYQWQKTIARSVVGYDEKGRKGIRAKRGWGKTHSVMYSDDYLTESLASRTVTDMTEVRTEYDPGEQHQQQQHHSKRYRDRDVHEYKREKPARVGGMNRVADGSHYDYSQSGSDLMTDTMTETSERPILPKATKKSAKEQRVSEKEAERAERKAREHAAKMERRWKREAEQAAAAAEAEATASVTTYDHPEPDNLRIPPPSARRSAAPSAKPSSYKPRREGSPRKANNDHHHHEPLPTRDFSYTTGDASETLSTIYTASEGTGTHRAPSYYDEYRPRASETRARQSPSPRKKSSAPSSSRYQGAGYRRGGVDSDLE